jgi:hypothetical protein
MDNKCKNCGGKLYHCESCWGSPYYDHTFCSSRCERSFEQKPEIIEAIERILNQLDDQGKEDLGKILYPYEGEPSGGYGDGVDFDNREDGDFDEDIVKDVLRKVFKDKLKLTTWGLW